MHHFSTTPLTWPCIWRLRKWKASGRWCWHIRVTLQIVFILSLTVVANNIVWWLFHFTVRPENGIINCISICCAIHAMCWKYSFSQKDIIVIYLFASTKQRENRHFSQGNNVNVFLTWLAECRAKNNLGSYLKLASDK